MNTPSGQSVCDGAACGMHCALSTAVSTAKYRITTAGRTDTAAATRSVNLTTFLLSLQQNHGRHITFSCNDQYSGTCPGGYPAWRLLETLLRLLGIKSIQHSTS